MSVKDHFFSPDKGDAEAAILPEKQSGVDDFHLGRSEEVINEEERRRKAAEDAISARVAEEASHTVFDEHSGRTERAAAAEGRSDERPNMRVEYNHRQFDLTRDDRSNLERVTDRGRQAFDGLLDISRIDRVAARFGMSFDNRLLEKSNKNTRELSVKVTSIDEQIKKITRRNKVAETGAERSSLADVLIKARNEKIGELQRRRDDLMVDIGKHEADAKISEINRNKYVDWMIRRNAEKTAPLEAHKMKLREDLREFDEKHAPLITHFQRVKAEVELFEKQKINGIKEAEEIGLSKKEIKDEIKKFDDKIKHRRDVLKEWDEIKLRRAKMEQKIAQISQEISKVDRRKEYEAIKNKKPFIVTSQEDAVPGPAPVIGEQERHDTVDANANPENHAEAMFRAGDILELWKKHFVQNVGFTITEAIEPEKFVLDGDEQLTIEGFKQKLAAYYQGRFPGATALMGDINEAIGSFAGNEEELRAALQELEDEPAADSQNEQENNEKPKLWVQDITKKWNEFIQEQLKVELANDADMRRNVIISPGEFVNRDDIPQNVDFNEFEEIVNRFYDNKPEISVNVRRRLEREYQNFLEKNA